APYDHRVPTVLAHLRQAVQAAAEPQRGEDRADHVEAPTPPPLPGPQQEERQKRRHDPDGQVDEEDEAPVEVGHDVAADRGPERRPGDERDGEESQRQPALLWWEGAEYRAGGQGNHRPAGQALEKPPDDE